jgi:hypothetical protein
MQPLAQRASTSGEITMVLSSSTIRAIIEGLRRVRRIPEREWLEPIIEGLEALQPGERLVIQRLSLEHD